jgi:hypothetical protein
VAEWARLGERFGAEVLKSKMLFFLGMILEDADPAERQAMMANLPAAAAVPVEGRWPAPVPPPGEQDPRRARPSLIPRFLRGDRAAG